MDYVFVPADKELPPVVLTGSNLSPEAVLKQELEQFDGGELYVKCTPRGNKSILRGEVEGTLGG